jgi:hypothetical protein
MFILPHVALSSAMACRVFRGLKLGLLSDNVNQSLITRASVPLTPHSEGPTITTNQHGLKSTNLDTYCHSPAIQMTKTTDFVSRDDGSVDEV